MEKSVSEEPVDGEEGVLEDLVDVEESVLEEPFDRDKDATYLWHIYRIVTL